MMACLSCASGHGHLRVVQLLSAGRRRQGRGLMAWTKVAFILLALAAVVAVQALRRERR